VNIRRISAALIFIVLGFNPSTMPTVQAQQPSTTPVPPAAEQARSAVTLDGEEIFYVSNFKAYSSEMRARRISGALKNAADDHAVSPHELKLFDDAISTDIMVGDQILFSLVDADVGTEAISRLEFGKLVVGKTATAIEKYRRARAPRHLLMSCLFTLLATLAFVAVLMTFVQANRRFMVWLQARIQRVQVQSRELVQADWALRIVTGVWGPLRLVILCGLSIGYLELVLSLFPWTRPFAFKIFDYVVVPLKVMASSAGPEIPRLLFIAVLAVVTYYLLKLTRFLFSAIESGRIVVPGFYADWSRPTFNIVRVLGIACAMIVAFPYVPGSNSLAFQGVSVFLGVLLSLGSTSAVSNMVAGVLLTYMRAFKVGDIVTIGDSTGVVTAVSMFVTHVCTFRNEEISIPNGMVLTTHVTNFSNAARDKGLILHTAVMIGYDTPWRQVEALLLMAAQRTSGLLREPAPFVLQTSLDDFCIRYELHVATGEPLKMRRAYSELHANIQDAFNEYGVQIMVPHYEADRSAPTFVPKERWFASPAKVPTRSGSRMDPSHEAIHGTANQQVRDDSKDSCND
jgi:small-conductance mechanosensitive channel